MLAQAPSTSDSPKLTERFTFQLGRFRDHAAHDVLETITRQSDSQQVLVLHEANQGTVDRLLDLTRFVPFKLSDSDMSSDEFFTPNYLRPDYDRPPPDLQLLNSR